MASRLDRTNLLTQGWQNIYDLVNTRSNVADPLQASNQFRKFVYSRDPDVKATDFAGYPFVIVHQAMMNVARERASVDMKSKMLIFTVEIEVVSSDRGQGNENDKGLTYNNQISDDIAETFNSKTNKIILHDNAIYFANLLTAAVVPEPRAKEMTYRRSFILGFQAKIQVSA